MSLIASDYHCNRCGPFESFEERPAPDFKSCPECGELAEWRIGAPMPRVKTIRVQSVSTGKSDPLPPGCISTRPIGEGRETTAEWHARLNKEDADKRRKWVREKIG